VRFEWDPDKDEINREKHGIAFDEVIELFTTAAEFLEIYDDEHSDEEERFIGIGPTASGFVVVVYTEREDDVVRIVSARKASKREIELYRKTLGGIND